MNRLVSAGQQSNYDCSAIEALSSRSLLDTCPGIPQTPSELAAIDSSALLHSSAKVLIKVCVTLSLAAEFN
jgi:hypothetical protein